MLVVGLTGGIGSGKSTVSGLLARRGAVVIDADVIVRRLQQPGTAVFDAIVGRFGDAVVTADGALDRRALADVVFADPTALADLNAIVHPAVGAVIDQQVAALSATEGVVVLDVPLLVESGRYRVAGTIVVDAPEDVAVARLVLERGMTPEQARARMARQASRRQRLAQADLVIDNRGSMADLEVEVERAWRWVEGLS